MLGTGNALVTECYNTCFILKNENGYLLVDGGGGNEILSRLKKVNISFEDIRNIFVTHKHIDHILGIIWLIRMICHGFSSGKFKGEYNICAHEEVIRLIKEMSFNLLRGKESNYIGKNLKLIEVKDKDEMNIIGQKFTFFDIHSNKAKQFGFTTDINGQKFTCCGDEPYNKTIKDYVTNADWLMHEAFCLDSEAEIFNPYEKQHSTVKDACEKAEALNVKNLILYHTEDKNINNRKELYYNEGKHFFQGNLYIPNDLEIIKI